MARGKPPHVTQPRNKHEPRIRLEADARRAQILEAASACFAENAYGGVTTSMVAKAAGTTRTNLHYYFKTKRDLYLEVVRQFGALPRLHGDGTALATGAEELDRLMGRWLDALEHNPQMIMALIETSAPTADPEVAAVFWEGAKAWQDRLIVVMQMPDSRTSRALLRAFQGMAGVAVAEWLQRKTLSKDDVRQLLVGTLLSMIGLPAGRNSS